MESSAIGRIRLWMGLLTLAYFADAMTDVAFWFGPDAAHSTVAVAEFLQLADLEDVAAVSVSPLFLVDAVWIYQVYLIVGMALAVALMAGRGGRWVTFSVWLWVVFYANRLLWLSGLTETLLSLTLFSTAFAAPHRNRLRKDASGTAGVPRRASMATGVAIRLTAIQGSLVAAVTCGSMLAGRVWWNGTGSVAMAAPESIRTLDLVSWLENPFWHEPISWFLIVAVPFGLTLAWRNGTARFGAAVLVAWALLVAVLGSHWIYGGVLACSVYSIGVAVGLGRTPPAFDH